VTIIFIQNTVFVFGVNTLYKFVLVSLLDRTSYVIDAVTWDFSQLLLIYLYI